MAAADRRESLLSANACFILVLWGIKNYEIASNRMLDFSISICRDGGSNRRR
jgi:hypothetical protein